MHRFSFHPPDKSAGSALSRIDGVNFVWRNSAPSVAAQLPVWLSQPPWPRGLILAAIGAQAVNMLLAMYMTQQLGFGDVLLDIFGRWDMALVLKCGAFLAWWVHRESLPARALAWVLAPLSILALTHDLLLLL